eukprot:g47557.t1
MSQLLLHFTDWMFKFRESTEWLGRTLTNELENAPSRPNLSLRSRKRAKACAGRQYQTEHFNDLQKVDSHQCHICGWVKTTFVGQSQRQPRLWPGIIHICESKPHLLQQSYNAAGFGMITIV